jgi:hypothetical protein
MNEWDNTMDRSLYRQGDLTFLCGLILAGLLVAVAIVADGAVAKTFNGLGGIVWIGSAVRLLLHLRREERFLPHLLMTILIGLILVLLAKPDDFVAAAIGFGCGGAVIALVTGGRAVRWALLLAAMWLPLHLTVAVIRVVERAVRDLPASIRRDPPPTAAFVPLSMILAAWLGAVIVEAIRERRARANKGWVDQAS